MRLTPALGDVLACLREQETEVWGLLVAKSSGRPTGTVYPILDRLERERLLESRWDLDSERSGPPRRLYKLTEAGMVWVDDQLSRRARVEKTTS